MIKCLLYIKLIFLLMVILSKKLIHIPKKIFFFVGAICNLATEFNGLVSTKG